MCLTGAVGSYAQSDEAILSSFPVVPMNVRFRFVPQYFVQQIDDDPKYSRIEALIDDGLSKPWYEIILADKMTGDRVIYSNSEETVDMLRGVGKTAYRSDIQFEFLPQKDSVSMYQIGLRDGAGQPINWKFAVRPKTLGVQSGFMGRPNASGFVLMGLDQRAAAMPGTTLIIGNAHYPVTSTRESTGVQFDAANSRAFYGTGLTVAEIMPGAELWLVDSLPDALKVDEKWILHSTGGKRRVLTIKSVHNDQVVIDQIDEGRSFHVRLDVRREHDELVLCALSVLRQSHNFRISFRPGLPFPGAGLNDATNVNFALSEDSQTDVAHGNLLARRRFIDENIDWKFDAPDWARARLMETGASVLIEAEISRGKPVK